MTFALRDSLDIIRQLKVPVREIRSTGGGAKSELWRQMQADIFGKRVVTLRAEQGPAYGVALLAAVAGGEYKNIAEACSAVVKVKTETKPDAKAQPEYNAAFPVFQKLYRSLKEDFALLGE